jgi:hypothetical protein
VDSEKVEIRKRKPAQIRWCGDLRTVLDRGPFDAPEDATDGGAQPPTERPTTHAA